MAIEADALLLHVLADEFRTHLVALRRLTSAFAVDTTRIGLLRDARQRSHTIAASAFVLGEELLVQAGQAVEQACDHLMSHLDDRVVLAALLDGLEDLEFLVQAMAEGSSGSRVAQQRGSEAVDRLTSAMSPLGLPTIDGGSTALADAWTPSPDERGPALPFSEITLSTETSEVEAGLVSSVKPSPGALLRAETQRLLVPVHEQMEILLVSPDDERAVGDLCRGLETIAATADLFGQPLLASAAIALITNTRAVADDPEALSGMLDDMSGSLGDIERKLERWCGPALKKTAGLENDDPPIVVPLEGAGAGTRVDAFADATSPVARLHDVDTSWWGARSSDQELGWTDGGRGQDRGDSSAWSASSTSDDDRDPDYGSDVAPSNLDFPSFDRFPADAESTPVDLDDLWKEIEALQFSKAEENGVSQVSASDDDALGRGDIDTTTLDERRSFDLFVADSEPPIDQEQRDQGYPIASASSMREEQEDETASEARPSSYSNVSQRADLVDLADGEDARLSAHATSLGDDDAPGDAIRDQETEPPRPHQEPAFHSPDMATTAAKSDPVTEGGLPTVVVPATALEAERSAVSDVDDDGHAVLIEIARLDAMLSLVGEIVANRSSLEQRLAHMRRAVNDLSTTTERLRGLETSLGTKEARELFRNNNNPDDDFNSLEMDGYSDLELVSTELKEMVADVASVDRELHYLLGEFDAIRVGQARITTEMEARLHQARLVNIETAPGKTRRTGRGVARRQG